VELRLESADVLHSFWVPALAGKLDMIPGRTNRLRVRADAPGEFRGQCAEYCGGPHALMAFHVLASDADAYERWAAAQRAPARAPDDELLEEGRALLGAGLGPVNAGAIAAWITSAQHLKPGNLMPEFTQFSGAELRALAAYLESLR
jgi:cytochrome c oxidase subunit 2